MQIFKYINNNKIIKYVFSGGTAFCVHLSTLFALTNYFQKFWTFKDYSVKNMHVQFSSFLFLALFTLAINTFLMYIFVDKFGLWYIFAQIIINIFTAFLSYLVYNKVVFVDSKKAFTPK